MDNLEIAKALFGTKPTQPNGNQTTTTYGIATSDSVNGSVRVNLGGDTVSMDDDQTIEVDTTFAVFEGDEVIVSLVGADGTGKAPCVIGVVGRGDQQQTEINSVINYVWNDEHGLHVSTAERSVQGPNILLDSDSLDIRNGVSNSEQDQTVYASFGREVTVGSRGTIPGQGQGLYSQVYGEQCIANGAYSHAEGYSNTVTGGYSHVEGASNTVGAMYSHAEGMSNVIEAKDGQGMTVSYNHVEGRGNNLQGDSSHVEGWSNTVVGQYHHIEGSHNNVEAGFGNHVEGVYNETNGSLYSVHVEGAHNISSSDYQHVQGKFNVEDANGTYQDIIGNGVNNARSNAYNMDWSGNAEFQGVVYVGGCTPNGETPYPVMRYNSSLSRAEYFNGSAWVEFAGGGGGGGGIDPTDAILRVIAPAGSTVTITKGLDTRTDSGHANAVDPSLYDYYFIINQSDFDGVNPWTVTATDGVDTATDTVIIDSADEYDVMLSYKFYLYNSGNEYTSLTGGFEYLAILSGSYSKVSPVKNASSIRLAPSGSGKQSSAVTVNGIDLTDFSTLYVNITEFDNTGSGYKDIIVKSSRTSGTTFAGDRLITGTGIFTIDVSSLSGSYYIGVFCNSSSSSAHCYISFDKIWLE